jgi:hypothetical protein
MLIEYLTNPSDALAVTGPLQNARPGSLGLTK